MKTLWLVLVGCIALAASGASALPNLVVNGDFEAGNTGFASDYLFSSASAGQGQYFVGANAQSWNHRLIANPDHAQGDGGMMLLGNGAATAAAVWFSSDVIPVASDTDYFFEAWVMNLCCRPGTLGNGADPVEPSVLSFYANDELLGTRASSELGVWEPLSTIWSSGSATSVLLRLVNSNTAYAGNDFAIDDIFLGTESSIVPEPMTALLVLAGLGGLAARRKRGRRAAA
jgi:hypothetical protein